MRSFFLDGLAREKIDQEMRRNAMKHKKVAHKKESGHQGYTPDPNVSGSVAPAKKKGASQAHKHGGHHSPAKPE
jgi:hypothetical protein